MSCQQATYPTLMPMVQHCGKSQSPTQSPRAKATQNHGAYAVEPVLMQGGMYKLPVLIFDLPLHRLTAIPLSVCNPGNKLLTEVC